LVVVALEMGSLAGGGEVLVDSGKRIRSGGLMGHLADESWLELVDPPSEGEPMKLGIPSIYFKKWVRNPPMEHIQAVIEAVKGRATLESESHVSESGWESRDGYVTVYAGRGATAAQILRRCGSKVLAMSLTRGGSDNPTSIAVDLRICRSAFRGLDKCFKPVDIESGPAPDFWKKSGDSEESDDTP
jgi:hypothetical protein